MSIWEMYVCGIETSYGSHKNSNDENQKATISQQTHQRELQNQQIIYVQILVWFS